MNARLETVDGRPALRLERRLSQAVERVWRAVTEPAELARWFPLIEPPRWTPAVGEVIEAAGQTGEVTEVDSPHRIAWTWEGDRFGFELQPDGEGCLLTFTHVFSDRSLGAQHAAGWEIYFNRLDAHLAGGFLDEQEAHKAFPELRERYAQQFG